MKKANRKKQVEVPSAPVKLPPGLWNLHEKADRNEGVITTWISDSNWSVKTRANFDRSLDQLRPLGKQHWHKPAAASKIGNHTYVIRFKDVNGEQLRVFGHFFEDHHAFVMTINGHEKDDVYHPKEYKAMAESERVACNHDFTKLTLRFEKLCAAFECSP